jgi:hypothetical protein
MLKDGKHTKEESSLIKNILAVGFKQILTLETGRTTGSIMISLPHKMDVLPYSENDAGTTASRVSTILVSKEQDVNADNANN